ncbi:hypothetical protein CEP51_007264 [Fusarium floridanum]|uniref:DUF7580 domain-containing protein n=1 Tax=Fusarium floridanum TaxID=1325733 RepID=A0A428RPU8_9HYPO|nr:hypothetical protein CEP51_007264 [Fusarium floridanum]
MASLQSAIQASDCLRAVAEGLCVDTSCVQFCATLQVLLANIAKWLRTLPSDEGSKSEAAALLDQLEAICRDPAQSGSPTEEPYPALSKLMAEVQAVTPTIRNLASSKACQPQRRTALASLSSFLTQIPEEKIAISPSDTDLRSVSEDPPEYGREIVSLHRALFMHCCCAESKKVVAHIKLHNYVQDDAKRAVTFEDHTTCHYERVGLDSDPSFCTYISTQEEQGLVLLYFSVIGQKLYYEKLDEPPRLWDLDRPSISLGQLLGEMCDSANGLTEKMKEVLSWLLAKAVWQYYSSPWMHEPWNKESVHFLFEKRRTGRGEELSAIFVNEPVLSVSIVPNPRGTEANKTCQQLTPPGKKPCRPLLFGRPLHPIPKILALGVMLVEIQLGRPMESLYGTPEWSRYCPKGKANPNTNFKICRDLIAGPDFFADISDPLEKLIRDCIRPNNLFVPPHIKDEEDIREALYGLVNRLEVYLSKRKPNNVKPLSLPQLTTSCRASMSESTARPVSAPARSSVPRVLPSNQPRGGPPKTETHPFYQA